MRNELRLGSELGVKLKTCLEIRVRACHSTRLFRLLYSLSLNKVSDHSISLDLSFTV